MTRGVQKVRRAIRQRKKLRNRSKDVFQHSIPFIQEEDKHGVDIPLFSDRYSMSKRNRNHYNNSGMAFKALASILLFAGIAFVLLSEGGTMTGTKNWLSNQLQTEFPFAKVKSWYTETLGEPLSITPQGNKPDIADESFALPVMGQVVETFNANGTGIMILPEKESVVTSLDEGVVIFAGNNKNTKKTIIIQHSDGSNSTYGYLSSIDVHLYQNIHANERIGTFSPTDESEVVYFSIEKDNQYIDPQQVIPVDDLP